MMMKLFQLFLFSFVLLIGIDLIHTDGETPESLRIRNRYAFLADKGLISQFANKCSRTYLSNSHDNEFNMEKLIHLIERLEDHIANRSQSSQFNSPNGIGRMLLQRFNMEAINFETMEQKSFIEYMASIDSIIVGLFPNLVDYYFPDEIYTEDELCLLLYTFSHKFDLVDGKITERGVIAFRRNPTEAIAPSNLIAGIISAYSQWQLSGKDISSRLSVPMSDDIRMDDGVLAVTFANRMGSGSFFELSNSIEPKMIYGLKGYWHNETYLMFDDGLVPAKSIEMIRKCNRASLAQIRGSLDGFIIGRRLRSNHENVIKLSLSTILRMYYSSPEIVSVVNQLGVHYCDRTELVPTAEELKRIGQQYEQIYNYIYSLDGAKYYGDQLYEHLMHSAIKTQSEFCSTKPSMKKTYKIRCTMDEL